MSETDWDALIDLVKSELRDCPFCKSKGREVRLTPGGQTWMGVRYSDPQYWELIHFCEKPDDDPFVTGNIRIRVRDLDDAVKRWNAQ